jgi:DNA-binding winged helix-turn-helix (wHTH) protein
MSQSDSETHEQPRSTSERFHLGDWVVSPDSGEIAKGRAIVRIEPKAMDVLVYLATHEGDVVSREDLERHVWRGAIVGYDAVTGTVIKLRKALDDDARQPRYIATVPKRGYRMLPGVIRLLQPGDAKTCEISPPVDSAATAFAGTEADPRAAAEQLGVRYVLQGSMRRSGDKVRVTTKVVDTEDGAHLWAEQFDGEVGDLFAYQDRVAKHTAAALSVTLTEDERRSLSSRPTTSFSAYEDYLRGRMFYGSLTKQENDLARAMYRRAIKKDPNFALAYAGMH